MVLCRRRGPQGCCRRQDGRLLEVRRGAGRSSAPRGWCRAVALDGARHGRRTRARGCCCCPDHSPRRRRPGRADGPGPGGHRAGHVGGARAGRHVGNVVVAVVRVRVARAPARRVVARRRHVEAAVAERRRREAPGSRSLRQQRGPKPRPLTTRWYTGLSACLLPPEAARPAAERALLEHELAGRVDGPVVALARPPRPLGSLMKHSLSERLWRTGSSSPGRRRGRRGSACRNW